jgi:hypothetical protein
MRREGVYTFEYQQEGYNLYLMAQKLESDLTTPKITFVVALGTALKLQRSPIAPEKVNEIAENIKDAIRVFTTVPMFKNDPPLDTVLFAMNEVLDWSPSEKPFP